MNLPDLLKITTFVLDMLTDIHHSLQKSNNSYKIDHFDYSCDKFMKFEFFYEK